jgi:arylsulfatase A-like enzyme
MRNSILPVFASILCFLCIHRSAAAPNIILIMSDDMGYSDIGCYGGEIQTPVLDKLAANGLRFTQFYNTARCCPTRAALLTGVYQHQAGIGLMTGNSKLPGYQGDIGRNVVTISEALRSGGYRNYMSGKWHVTKHTRPDGPKDNWPIQRGFDRFYGTITGAGSFYDPATLCRGNQFITPVNDPAYQPKTYYYTDAISDNAVMFIQQHEKDHGDQPFFLYMAFTTAHWPMHALPEDIAKYKGVYDEGFEPIRKKRLARMKQIGLVKPDVELSRATDNWERTPHKEWEIRNMEVYAAMVDRMDQGIGKVVDELKRLDALDNTLVLYLQDNGGCAEGYGRYTPKNGYREYKPMGPDEFQTKIWTPMQTRDGRAVRTGPGVMAGPEDTFIGYGRGWANVSNTPFREFKHFAHEGGISTPLVAHWPDGIDAARQGKLDPQPGHVIDLLATCVDVAGVDYPKRYGDTDIIPPEGISLKPAFSGKSLARSSALFWEHHLNCGIRDGKWKLVRYGNGGENATLRKWELYDMEADRAESTNLSDRFPEKVKQLDAKWEAWAIRALVKPWPYTIKEGG